MRDRSRPRPESPRAAPGAIRALVTGLAFLFGSMAGSAVAEGTKVKMGVLQLSSSAPIFLGVERGVFREFGIEPELVYFQGAQPATRRRSRRTGRGRSPS